MRKLYLILFWVPFIALAHPGGQDNIGGHFNRKTGEYHCHSDKCRKIHAASDEAFEEAKEEGRELSLVYDRDDWKHWSDLDSDCQDTRAETLIRDNEGTIKFETDKGCQVDSGKWTDPYSGKVYFDDDDLDIDHIVPLEWAHRHGAANWSVEKKEKLANDPSNVLAVYLGLNRSKGSKGPLEWLPPREAYQCLYVLKFYAVANEYGLELEPSELTRSQKLIKKLCN